MIEPNYVSAYDEQVCGDKKIFRQVSPVLTEYSAVMKINICSINCNTGLSVINSRGELQTTCWGTAEKKMVWQWLCRGLGFELGLKGEGDEGERSLGLKE